jgi:hypothetical protein
VSALHESSSRPQLLDEEAGRSFRSGASRGVDARERLSLREIGRDQRGAGDQILERVPGSSLQKRLAIARRQDRIDHDGWEGLASGLDRFESKRHRAKHVVARQHADLDGVGDEVLQEPPHLIQHHRWKHRQHLMHLRRVLNGQGGHHARAMHAEGAEHLQVEL